MSNNYDGSSVGQKNAQYGALDEIYRRWDAASSQKQDEGTSERAVTASNKSSLLPTIAVAVVAVALIVTVAMVGWALL